MLDHFFRLPKKGKKTVENNHGKSERLDNFKDNLVRIIIIYQFQMKDINDKIVNVSILASWQKGLKSIFSYKNHQNFISFLI